MSASLGHRAADAKETALLDTAPSDYIAREVYFPIEIMSREYGGHLLLAAETATRGRRAVIGHKGPVARAMRAASEPGLLFYKHTWLRDWFDDRHAFVGQDPEAGMSIADYADFYASGRIHLPGSQTRGQFCHGADEYEFLRSQYPDDAHRIFLTGSPRVSLWGSDGDVFYSKQVSEIAKRYGRFVLFTSAAGGFPHERVLAAAELDVAAWEDQDSAHHFFSCARFVAREIDIPVIIRPHPYESWEAWNRLVAPVKNLFLESVFDLSAWTRGACAVVHPGESTAALESVVAGRPAISTNSYPTSLALPISHIARDNDDLLALIKAARSGTLAAFPSAEARSVVERKVFYPLSGAARRIADVLDGIAPTSGSSGLKDNSGEVRPRRRVPVVPNLRAARQTELGRSVPPAYKRPPLTMERIRRDVENAATILGIDRPRIAEYSKNCFVLSRG